MSTMFTKPPAMPVGTPQPSTIGIRYGAMEEAPNEADRKPESVTPICTVERKVFGSRAILATLAPRASSCSICSICEPRRETNANSVPENTEPITRNTKIRRMFKPSDMPLTLGEWHVKLGCAAGQGLLAALAM